MAKKMSRRSQLVGAIFLLLFFVIIGRFFFLQVVEASFYQENAETMYHKELKLEAERGHIYDRSGNTLAMDNKVYNIVAILSEKDPHHVEDPQEVAEALAPLLDASEQELAERLSAEDLYETRLGQAGWRIDRETKEKIEELELSGIRFEEERNRYYPNRVFASDLLGFLNHEGVSEIGLEAHLNEYLAGEDGEIQFNTDITGRRLPQGIEGVKQPVDGYNIYLTLDERIQLIVENALNEVLETYTADRISVIVSDPKTGEILAMSNRPSFDPNNYSEIESYLNPAVSSPFEPGSTFKIVALAAAVEEGVFDEEDTFMSGRYEVKGGVVRDHNRSGWGEISYLEGVQYSSNVAFAKLVEELGKGTFYRYIYDFGFGELTGVDLPHENSGKVWPAEEINEHHMANMSFGQGLSVNALQIVQATNVIANGGKLMQPYIVDRIEDGHSGDIVEENDPRVMDEEVISKETADEVKHMLRTVVTDGTGQRFNLDGYQVAGKTGTAQKALDGRYVPGEYIHSFTGFAPLDDPQLTVYVMVDTPKKMAGDPAPGGDIVADIFKTVMDQSLRYKNIKPKMEGPVSLPDDESLMTEVPDVSGLSVDNARQKAEEHGFKITVFGDGSTVDEQHPEAGSEALSGDHLFFFAGSVTSVDVPDLTGLTMREVQDWAKMAQVDVHPTGHGYVVQQNKDPGKRIRQGEMLEVVLEPRYEHWDEEGEIGRTEEGMTDGDGATEEEGSHGTEEEMSEEGTFMPILEEEIPVEDGVIPGVGEGDPAVEEAPSEEGHSSGVDEGVSGEGGESSGADEGAAGEAGESQTEEEATNGEN